MTRIALILLALIPVVGNAGICDAHFTFDGNLQDAAGNGYHGQMIGQKGAPATPRFVGGKFGQALQFDGTSAMRSFVDLHFETCPQVTVTAWIQSTATATATQRKGSQYLVSTGSGSGPGFRMSSTSLVLNGTANGIIQRNAVRANAGWLFIAGVYDYAKGTYTLHIRNRSVDKELGTNVRAPEATLWVGAFNDDLAGPASGILIDDLRVYGRALGNEEIRKLQIGETEKNLVTSGPSLVPEIGSPVGDPLSQPPSIPGELQRDLPPGAGQRPQLIGDSTAPSGAINGQSCSSDSQCAESDDTIYRECVSSEDCTRAGRQCFDIAVPAESFEGSMCTNSCATDIECEASNGFTGACYSLGGLAAACYPRCDRDKDCNAGNRCISVTLPSGTLDGVCVPDNSLATN